MGSSREEIKVIRSAVSQGSSQQQLQTCHQQVYSLPPGHPSLHSRVTLSWCKQEEGDSSKQLPPLITFSAPYSTTCSQHNLVTCSFVSVL